MPGKALFIWLLSFASVQVLVAGSDLLLVSAAKNRDRAAVRSLLKQHIDINASQADGATALAWASYRDDLEMADLLIHAGADVNAADDLGLTPLSLACSNSSLPMVDLLLKAGANVNAASRSGETPLMTCSSSGNLEAVKLLLSRGADVNAAESQRGQTALMWAAAEKHSEIAKLLVEHQANIHAHSKSGFTPLLFAARSGDLDSAHALIAAGAKVNEAANDDMTPLLIASASGHEALSIFLVENGADPNAADHNGITPLHFALQKGISLFRQLISHTPEFYSYAYRPNMQELVKALLAHGANPNARLLDNPEMVGSLFGSYDQTLLGGATPFLLAAATGDAAIMRMLAASGADPRLTTKSHATAAMIAACGGSPIAGYRHPHTAQTNQNALDAVRLAVELGNDVNAADDFDMTALHYAAYQGINPIIQYLADQGSKTDVRDRFGMTPLSIAQGIVPATLTSIVRRPNGTRKETVELLRKLGATVTISEAQQ